MNFRLTDEIRALVLDAAAADGIVNVPVIARHVHAERPATQPFDIERVVLGFAELSGVPIVFDLARQEATYHNGLMLEFVTDDDEKIGDDLPTARLEGGRSRADDLA